MGSYRVVQTLSSSEVWEATCKKRGKTPWNAKNRLNINEKAEILTQTIFKKRGNQLKRGTLTPLLVDTNNTHTHTQFHNTTRAPKPIDAVVNSKDPSYGFPRLGGRPTIFGIRWIDLPCFVFWTKIAPRQLILSLQDGSQTKRLAT